MDLTVMAHPCTREALLPFCNVQERALHKGLPALGLQGGKEQGGSPRSRWRAGPWAPSVTWGRSTASLPRTQWELGARGDPRGRL